MSDMTKLTVRVPKPLLESAKHYARAHETTLTRLIVEHLHRLAREADVKEDWLRDAPIVRRLSGVLPPEATIEDYQDYLVEKYA
ncbi:MAG: hypothetical protein GXP42_00105 [Chloroflexi bacterium]|nr:hypothetical protein [Chloroflexota bacterium]